LNSISSNELLSCGGDDNCPFTANKHLLQSGSRMKLGLSGNPEFDRCFAVTTDADADCPTLAAKLPSCAGSQGSVCQYQNGKLEEGQDAGCASSVQESGYMCKVCWDLKSWQHCVDPIRPEGPPLELLGKDPKGPLKVCKGDCDKDSECEGGLKCFQRDGFTSVPGCSGVGEYEYDYCYDPNMPFQPSLKDFGTTPPNNKRPLEICAGDCDKDSECQPGLACFQREGTTPVPGCSGAGKSGYDYCYLPELNDDGENPGRSDLGKCTGDCDKDSACSSGFKCFQRDAFEHVPGCAGTGALGYDYCYDPKDA